MYPRFAVLLTLILVSGCASLSNRRSVGNTGERPAMVQFVGQANVSVVHRGDQHLQFFEKSLSLTGDALVFSSGWAALQQNDQHQIRVSEMETVALFPGGVTHPNQLQLISKKELVIVQVLGTDRSNDDVRTQQLYELLVSNGVARGRTDRFYYVGMDLSQSGQPTESDNLFIAAVGARFGEFIWGSIKGLGSLIVKPFKPF
jgi:hypothetical protein